MLRDRRLCEAAECIISSLFPSTVTVAASFSAFAPAVLSEAEAALVRNASEARKREFAAGRSCAKLALSRLGIRTTSILCGTDRVPIWPSGTVGSISHCEGLCAAVSARTAEVLALGLDVECLHQLSADVGALVVREDEVAVFPKGSGLDLITLAFSAKEAFYKAYYPINRNFIEFHDVFVKIELDAEQSGTFEIAFRGSRPGKAFVDAMRGRWSANNALVLCGAYAIVN